jgi:membrane-associated protease RseP (regulator of RpoE activity)
MSFVLGVVLFALILTISIAAHEFGHLLTAKMFGMKARRYFIGFGPKVWSFRRGETEYGLKAIPAGGFVDIAGMSHVEELHEDDEPRAFWRFPAWKRIVVMSAGSATHFALALVILYGLAVTAGLPSADAANAPTPAVVAEVPACVQAINDDGSAKPCTDKDPPSPAKQAGLQVGDKITELNGQPLANWDDLVTYVRAHPNADLTLTVQRAGGNQTLNIHTVRANRPVSDSSGTVKRADIGVLGASAQLPSGIVGYNPVTAVGGTLGYTGSLFKATFVAIGQFPSKIPKLLDALAGKPRDADTPVSVVGASKLGGQAVEAGQWQVFFSLLAGFNLFIGVFNLLPLLPLDGGHVAVLVYEKVRGLVYRARGKTDPGVVDQTKLAPIMLTVIFLVGSISLLTIYADFANPIANPFTQ